MMSEPTYMELPARILASVVVLATVVVFLALSVPLTGTLVRYRASYNPKGLALDAENTEAPQTSPIHISYFGMMARVYRIEGCAGLFKGVVSTVIWVFILSLITVAIVGTSMASGGRYSVPDVGPLQTFFYGVTYALIALPAMILNYRAIVTPYRLPFFNPSLALRVLLTPTERSRPWILYRTPGLLMSQVIHIAYMVFVKATVGRMLLKASTGGVMVWDLGKLGAYLLLVVLSTVLLSPLEVISIRLAVQRNHDGLYNSDQKTESMESLVDSYGESEDVVGLRLDRDPYTSMIDCAKRITEEEGVRALFRGWVVTALGLLQV